MRPARAVTNASPTRSPRFPYTSPRHAAPPLPPPPPQVKALAAHPEHARLHALLDVFAHGEGLAAYHKWLAAGSERDLEALGISNVRTFPAHARARTRERGEEGAS